MNYWCTISNLHSNFHFLNDVIDFIQFKCIIVQIQEPQTLIQNSCYLHWAFWYLYIQAKASLHFHHQRQGDHGWGFWNLQSWLMTRLLNSLSIFFDQIETQCSFLLNWNLVLYPFVDSDVISYWFLDQMIQHDAKHWDYQLKHKNYSNLDPVHSRKSYVSLMEVKYYVKSRSIVYQVSNLISDKRPC